jgi:hypothetical protein
LARDFGDLVGYFVEIHTFLIASNHQDAAFCKLLPTTKASMLLPILVVVIAILAGIHQIYVKPFLHIFGVGRVVESLGNQDCTIIPDVQACESGANHSTISKSTSLMSILQKLFCINRQEFFTWPAPLPQVASNGYLR